MAGQGRASGKTSSARKLLIKNIARVRPSWPPRLDSAAAKHKRACCAVNLSRNCRHPYGDASCHHARDTSFSRFVGPSGFESPKASRAFFFSRGAPFPSAGAHRFCPRRARLPTDQPRNRRNRHIPQAAPTQRVIVAAHHPADSQLLERAIRQELYLHQSADRPLPPFGGRQSAGCAVKNTGQRSTL